MNQTQTRNPVVLIHGIFDTAGIFRLMSAYLRGRGWDVHSFNLCPNYGLAGLDRLAEQISHYVEKTFPPGQPFDLVGFSMGGIVSRYYVQRLGGLDRVQRLIAISAPHYGTWLAYFYPTLGAFQMRPYCPFLCDLNRDIETLDQINFTSIWTPFDAMILPASSSRVPVGDEILLDVLLHAWMVRDSRCIKAVEKALRAPVTINN
ncbi:MAG: esterase/lipase family protein [Limnospira sp.]